MSEKQGKKTEQVIVILTPEELQEVEDYRYNNRIPSRSETLRQLIRAGLKVKKK